MQLLRYVLEVYHRIYVEHRFRLFGSDMFCHVLVESVSKLLHVFPFHRKSAGIGVTSEVDKQVAATLDGRIYIESCYTASRTCCKVSVTGQYHGRTEVDFRKSGCNDADDSLFPTFIIEYDAGVVFLCLQS